MKRARSAISDKASACFPGSASMMVICVTGCWLISVCDMAISLHNIINRSSQHDVQRTDDRGDVGLQMAAAEKVHHLQKRERGSADLALVRLVSAARPYRRRTLPWGLPP